MSAAVHRQSWATQACGKKKRYLSQSTADSVVRLRMADLVDPAPPLKSYECQFCGGWHISKLKLT